MKAILGGVAVTLYRSEVDIFRRFLTLCIKMAETRFSQSPSEVFSQGKDVPNDQYYQDYRMAFLHVQGQYFNFIPENHFSENLIIIFKTPLELSHMITAVIYLRDHATSTSGEDITEVKDDKPMQTFLEEFSRILYPLVHSFSVDEEKYNQLKGMST